MTAFSCYSSSYSRPNKKSFVDSGTELDSWHGFQTTKRLYIASTYPRQNRGLVYGDNRYRKVLRALFDFSWHVAGYYSTAHENARHLLRTRTMKRRSLCCSNAVSSRTRACARIAHWPVGHHSERLEVQSVCLDWHQHRPH